MAPAHQPASAQTRVIIEIQRVLLESMIRVIGIPTCPTYREDRHRLGQVPDGRTTKIGITPRMGDARGRAILSYCMDVTVRFQTSELASDRGRELTYPRYRQTCALPSVKCQS